MLAVEHELFSPTTAISLLLLSLGGFAIPLFCRPLKLPAAVGEILFGIVVGPYLLGWVDVSDFIRLLAQLGFFLLMFIAGLELDFTQIEKGGVRVLSRAMATTALIFGFSFAVVHLLGYNWFVSLVLGAISIGIPIVLLQETGMGKTVYGQNLLLVGSVGEFAAILMATALSAYSLAGGVNLMLGLELSKLIAVMLLAYVVLVVLRSLVWWKSESFARVVSSHDPAEIGVRAGLALMFIFVAITAELHIEPILGAFMAGALFSFVFRAKGALELKFMSIGNGFFVPFFFMSVGLELNLEAAKSGDFGMLIKLLIALFLVRFLAFCLTREKGVSLRQAAAGAFLLSAPLTLLVVVANLGLTLGLVQESFHATVILLALASATLYPFLFKWIVKGLPQAS